MKPKDCFGVLIRTTGVILAVYALWCLAYAAALGLGLPEETPHEHLDNLISAALAMMVALYLIRGAPHLVRFAYPKAGEGSAEDSQSDKK